MYGSSNGLVNHYHAVNHEAGHARGCGWGAGADCSCAKHQVTYYFVTALVGTVEPKVFILDYTENKERAQKYARASVKGGWNGVRCRSVEFHGCDDGAWEFVQMADAHRERLDDWASDGDYC